MKYDDTYSMIGAMLNQGFETEFKKEREKKEKRRRFFRKLIDVFAATNRHKSHSVERKCHKIQKCGLQIFSLIL